MEKTKMGNYDQTFALLEQMVGQEIICIYATADKTGLEDEHQYKGYRGTLNKVVAYDYISIDGMIRNFVGEFDAIVQLNVNFDGKPKTIFFNKEIPKDYHGYRADPIALINAQNEMLGYSAKADEFFNQDKQEETTQKKIK